MIENISIGEEPSKAPYRVELKARLMLKTGLRSDKQLAEALGEYHPNLVQGIFSGRVYPSRALQRCLCRVLEIKASELRQML